MKTKCCHANRHKGLPKKNRPATISRSNDRLGIKIRNFASVMAVYHDYVLENGLKIIHEPSPTDIVYCGIFVNAGTRDEEKQDSGLAHFCEHMSFKGTKKHQATYIRNCLESVGGDLNAYTNKEETVYYACIQKEHFDRAVKLLFDIVFNSTYPQKEIEKETEVIIDEIDCYNDSPAELIYDEFEEMIFRNHGLGRNILGKAETLRSYHTDDALRFTEKYYTPSNSTFFIYGNISFEHAIQMARRLSGNTPVTEKPTGVTLLPPYVAEQRTCQHHTHQAHVLIGNRAYSNTDKRKYALSLLNNILGGPGMNSLLNIALRERHGLVYTTESNVYYYSDTGVWSVYYGCDEKDVGKCRKIISGILSKLREAPISQTRLAQAKRQMIGQMYIAEDNFESHALALGKTYARFRHFKRTDEVCRLINEISSEELHQVAQDIFQEDKLSSLIYL